MRYLEGRLWRIIAAKLCAPHQLVLELLERMYVYIPTRRSTRCMNMSCRPPVQAVLNRPRKIKWLCDFALPFVIEVDRWRPAVVVYKEAQVGM